MPDTGSHDAGSRDAERVVSNARSQARRLGHRRIGTEHLLLGLLVDEQSGTAEVAARHVLLGVLDVEGLACQVLRRLDIDLAGLRRDAQLPAVAAPPERP